MGLRCIIPGQTETSGANSICCSHFPGTGHSQALLGTHSPSPARKPSLPCLPSGYLVCEPLQTPCFLPCFIGLPVASSLLTKFPKDQPAPSTGSMVCPCMQASSPAGINKAGPFMLSLQDLTSAQAGTWRIFSIFHPLLSDPAHFSL